MIETLRKQIKNKRNNIYINSLYTKYIFCKKKKIYIFLSEEDLIDIQKDFPTIAYQRRVFYLGKKVWTNQETFAPHEYLKLGVISILHSTLNSVEFCLYLMNLY